jgi:hypothetical protein
MLDNKVLPSPGVTALTERLEIVTVGRRWPAQKYNRAENFQLSRSDNAEFLFKRYSTTCLFSAIHCNHWEIIMIVATLMVWGYVEGY